VYFLKVKKKIKTSVKGVRWLCELYIVV